MEKITKIKEIQENLIKKFGENVFYIQNKKVKIKFYIGHFDEAFAWWQFDKIKFEDFLNKNFQQIKIKL